MIVRERLSGEFELVGPHGVSVALTPEQVSCLDGIAPAAVPEVVRSDPVLEPVSSAFAYLLRQEPDERAALDELARSVSGRRARIRPPAPPPERTA